MSSSAEMMATPGAESSEMPAIASPSSSVASNGGGFPPMPVSRRPAETGEGKEITYKLRLRWSREEQAILNQGLVTYRFQKDLRKMYHKIASLLPHKRTRDVALMHRAIKLADMEEQIIKAELAQMSQRDNRKPEKNGSNFEGSITFSSLPKLPLKAIPKLKDMDVSVSIAEIEGRIGDIMEDKHLVEDVTLSATEGSSGELRGYTTKLDYKVDVKCDINANLRCATLLYTRFFQKQPEVDC